MFSSCKQHAHVALGLELDGDLVNPETFPLPTIGRRLEALSRDVHHGKGFGLVRGIKPSSYCVEDLTLIFLGVQSYIADKVGRQDKRGNMLGKFRSPPFCPLLSLALSGVADGARSPHRCR